WACAYRGWARFHSGDYRRALVDLDRAVASGQTVAWVYQVRGVIRAQLRHHAAIDDLNEAIALGDDSESYLQRARVRARYENRDGALADLDEVIAGDRGCFDAYLARAQVHMQWGRSESALSDLDRAEALRPGCWMIDFLRATIREKSEGLDAALADL